jgi:hypothetical protein
MPQIDDDNDNAKERKGQLITYLRYRKLEDMLKVIIYSAQSALGLIPMLYHINYDNRQILFIQTGAIGGGGGIMVHYIVQNNNEKPIKKFIELKRLTGQFGFVDSIGTDTQYIYLPILELEDSTLKFPI